MMQGILALITVLLALGASSAFTAESASLAGTGTIVGRVTDQDGGAPVSGVYITVGYKGVKIASITDGKGRYIIPDVPAGQPADVFGFHGGGYRYHNSIYDDHLHIILKPGQIYTYNFTVRQLHDPAGEPEVSLPSITPDTVRPGETVTFGLTARGGKGGLSDEVMAASPKLRRLVLLTPAGGDNFRGTMTVPRARRRGTIRSPSSPPATNATITASYLSSRYT
jgi:hypothetical protein